MKLRSQAWFGRQDKSGFMYRTWMKSQGWPHVCGLTYVQWPTCNRYLQQVVELTRCNGHFRELAECVKRGVWEAGGLVEFPVVLQFKL